MTAGVVESVLAAYRRGYFPMAESARHAGPIHWLSPDPRAIIPLDALHVPRSLARRVRRGTFHVTSDRDFAGVIRGCAGPRPGEPDTWIDDRIITAYTALHEAGHAHSVEAWRGTGVPPVCGAGVPPTCGTGVPPVCGTGDPPVQAGGTPAPQEPERLVGGLYGVHIGGAFFAESKFSRPNLGGTDASKVCLVHLVHHLRRRGFTLLDVQMPNPHLAQFGVVEVPRAAYLAMLGDAVARRVPWLPFEPQRVAVAAR